MSEGICITHHMEPVRPKSKRGNKLTLNMFLNEKRVLRWDLKPQHTVYEADSLPNAHLIFLTVLNGNIFINYKVLTYTDMQAIIPSFFE